MYHLVAQSHRGRLLFRDWEEGLNLWLCIVRAVPNIVHMALMPDHVHLLHHATPNWELGVAMRAHTRWLNSRRETSGPLWQRQPEPVRLANESHHDRTIRYVLLNPCRARLVEDPLAWPLSTHRDAVGLVVEPIRRRVTDPYRFHEFVSGDPSVSVNSTLLPAASSAIPAIETVANAASAVLRKPMLQLFDHPHTRRRVIGAMRTLCDASAAEIGSYCGVTASTVRRVPPALTHSTRIINQVVADPRFSGLEVTDLRRRWSRYRWRI